jgi:hypothetical protein
MTKPVGFTSQADQPIAVETTLTIRLVSEDISDMQDVLLALDTLRADAEVEVVSATFLTAQGVRFTVAPGEGAYEIVVTT